MIHIDKGFEYFASMRKRIKAARTTRQIIMIMAEDMPVGYDKALQTQFNKQCKGKVDRVRSRCLIMVDEYANNYHNNQMDEAMQYMAEMEEKA